VLGSRDELGCVGVLWHVQNDAVNLPPSGKKRTRSDEPPHENITSSGCKGFARRRNLQDPDERPKLMTMVPIIVHELSSSQHPILNLYLRWKRSTFSRS
jgi:hypothetical protein